MLVEDLLCCACRSESQFLSESCDGDTAHLYVTIQCLSEDCADGQSVIYLEKLGSNSFKKL